MTKTYSINRDRIVALILFAIMTLYLIELRDLPLPVIDDGNIGAGLYGLLLVGVSYIFLGIIAYNSKSTTEITINTTHILQIVGFILLSLLYVFLLFRLGYFVASLIYGFGVIALFELSEMDVKKGAGVSLLIMVSVFILFTFIFEIRLPMGWFL